LTLFLVVSILCYVPVIDDPVRVGATVKALREAHGWALGKFASKVALSHGHLANIEAGRKRLTPAKARQIADLLRVPLAAITTEYSAEEVA
jgi:transcriptional regulator with XRE-family HTH domain